MACLLGVLFPYGSLQDTHTFVTALRSGGRLIVLSELRFSIIAAKLVRLPLNHSVPLIILIAR